MPRHRAGATGSRGLSIRARLAQRLVGGFAGGGGWGAIDPNFVRMPRSIRMRAADHERLCEAFPKDF